MQNNMQDEVPSTQIAVEQRYREYIYCPYRLYSDESLTDLDYIKLYEFVMIQFKNTKEGFDIKDPIFEVRDYLEMLPCVQEYMNEKGNEVNQTKSDDEIVAEIMANIERRQRDKKNPIKRLKRFF